MRIATLLAVCILVLTGCMPDPGPPTVQGTIDTSTASKLQASVRSSNGQSYQVEHQLGEKTFTANWLLGNALKKTSQLQIKPPADWTDVEIYQALDVVLNAHETKPWYAQIDDTVLRLVRQVIKDDKLDFAKGVAPDTPYSVAVKVKHHTTEWFLQVEVLILSDDGINVGF